MQEKLLYPKHIQIETVCGICTAKCNMCSIHNWKSKPIILSNEKFRYLLEQLQGGSRQEFLSLHGLGEVLLDKNIHTKIKMAKDMGFNGVGFPTNCTELCEETSMRLLDSGLDTLILSIDGTTKDVHEKIRIKTNFANVVKNAKKFIEIRNNLNYKTRILVRFIYQDDNMHQWDEYQKYWNLYIDKDRNDGVLRFDVHNWGNADILKNTILQNKNNSDCHEPLYCEDLYDRLMIRADGTLLLCCAGDTDIKSSNAFQRNPIELFNSEPFIKYRKAQDSGVLHELPPCNTCSIVHCRKTRIFDWKN